MPSPISTSCPHCGSKFRLKDASAAGKKMKCRKCEEAFVIKVSKPRKRPDSGPSDDGFGSPEMEAAGGLPPRVGTGKPRKRKPKKVDPEAEAEAAAKQAVETEQPKWVKPVVITGIALVSLGVLGGGGYAISTMLKPSGPVITGPVTYVEYKDKNNSAFRCQHPSDWDIDGGGASGSSTAWVRFKKSGITMEIKESRSGGAMGDIMGAGSDPNEQDESRTPVAKLHAMREELFAEEYSDYQVQGTTTVKTGMGDARQSEWSASVGFGSKIKGYRLTLLNAKGQFNILCKCPESDWKTVKPIFDKFIESISTM